MEKNNTFGLITNRVFYITSDEDGISLLDLFKRKDGKVILVLYYLYKRKSICDEKIYISLKSLMESCNYKSDVKENIKAFKEILYKLKEIKIIDFKQEIKDKNILLEIDCSNLLDEDDGYFNFFILEQEEIDLIRSNTTNNQNFITDLKVYCYLKARVKKIDKDRNIFERGGGETETTWRSYEDITKYTGVRAVEKSIRNLKEIGLIDYVNAGGKRKKSATAITYCSNVYALTRLSKDIKLELKEGLKQYIHYEKENGNIIIPNYQYIKEIRSKAGKKGIETKKRKTTK